MTVYDSSCNNINNQTASSINYYPLHRRQKLDHLKLIVPSLKSSLEDLNKKSWNYNQLPLSLFVNKNRQCLSENLFCIKVNQKPLNFRPFQIQSICMHQIESGSNNKRIFSVK